MNKNLITEKFEQKHNRAPRNGDVLTMTTDGIHQQRTTQLKRENNSWVIVNVSIKQQDRWDLNN